MEYVLPNKNNIITNMNPKQNVLNNSMTSTMVSNDRNKEWRTELVMERLRSKASSFKQFQDTSKAIRMGLMEKRHSLDSVEKSQLEKGLDTLQHEIKVTSLQGFIERLESLTRQLGLKFMPGKSGEEHFISSEMFYLEINLESTGAVKDVKVYHDGQAAKSCEEFVRCLSQGDFTDFASQLEGLASLYQINAEKDYKKQAFVALQALEADLMSLYQLQNCQKDPMSIVYTSRVGVLQKRRGGHPMKLTYFVSAYELLNKDLKISEPLSMESVTSGSLGHSVTVSLEGSGSHQLATTPIVACCNTGAPVYSPLNQSNSLSLPACFVLKLNKPLPLCTRLAKQIQDVTKIEIADLSIKHPMLSLITQHSSKGVLDSASSKAIFVTLPDQNHCYFMTERRRYQGIMVTSIPFTHPEHVPEILSCLRHQAFYNELISSCIRPQSKHDIENSIIIELTALTYHNISISLEHPIEETMGTVDIQMKDLSNPIVMAYFGAPGETEISKKKESVLLSKVLLQCMSIPILLRFILKRWEVGSRSVNSYNGLQNGNFSLGLGAGDPGGRNGSLGSYNSSNTDQKLKMDTSSDIQNHGQNRNLFPTGVNHPHEGNYIAEPSGMALFASEDNSEMNYEKKKRKRSKADDAWSNKRKTDDSELMESSSSDSTSVGTPNSRDGELAVNTPNSAVGFPDFELSTLDPTELIGNSSRTCSDFDNSVDGELHDIPDVEELIKSNKKSKKSDKRSPSLGLDHGEKTNFVPPSVSILPISTNSSPAFTSVLTGMGLERRPGIEIIPIASSPAASLPSSITITPIASSQVKNLDERSRDRKSSKSKSDDKNRLEKKRKKKREESPMGPPDKLPPKQDPLNKPIAVSINKSTDGVTLTSSIRPSSPGLLRKFSASPTHGRSVVGKSGSSPGAIKPLTQAKQSPKHSPVHSSPKHTMPGLHSPKNHGTSSPKHTPSGGSGKPSMSTLKSAANSPSSKSDSSKSKSKDSNRDKDRKSSSLVFSGSSSPKIKSSSVKLKQLDLTATSTVDMQNAQMSGDYLVSPSSFDINKVSTSAQARNRKGSLSAVIDKLKSAQHCGDSESSSSSKSQNKERSSTSSSKTSESRGNVNSKIPDTKNQEYMVKPSSEGIKITINKTRTKDSSSNKTSSSINKAAVQSSTGTGSPKTHTGLKPGVNSGPASKKPQQSTIPSTKLVSSTPTNFTSSTITSNKTNMSISSPKMFQKTILNSSTTLTSIKSKSSSPKMILPTDLTKNRDKNRVQKNSEKNIFNKNETRRSSPGHLREETDSERVLKMALAQQAYTPQLMVEGLMKSFDTKFQIPKLSARVGDDAKKMNDKVTTPLISPNDLMNNRSNSSNADTVAAKMFADYLSKDLNNANKYPYQLGNKLPLPDVLDGKLMKNQNITNQNQLGSSSPKLNPLIQKGNDSEITLTLKNQLDSKTASSKDQISSDYFNSIKQSEQIGKFTPPHKVDDKKLDNKSKSEDILLDFSNKSDLKLTTVTERQIGSIPPRRNTPPLPNLGSSGGLMQYPNSPSVSVHIVKSPVASPLVVTSPHSNSPCITDDEFADDTLVGMGK